MLYFALAWQLKVPQTLYQKHRTFTTPCVALLPARYWNNTSRQRPLGKLPRNISKLSFDKSISHRAIRFSVLWFLCFVDLVVVDVFSSVVSSIYWLFQVNFFLYNMRLHCHEIKSVSVKSGFIKTGPYFILIVYPGIILIYVQSVHITYVQVDGGYYLTYFKIKNSYKHVNLFLEVQTLFLYKNCFYSKS